MSTGQVVNISLVPGPDADFEVRLYGPDERSLESGYSPRGEQAELSYATSEAGAFLVKVYRSSGEGNYQLNLDVDNQNDAGSGKDASDYGIQAYPIGPGSFTGFLKDDDDDDWYHFDVTKGQIISADLSVPVEADFDLYLYRPNGSTAETGHSSKGEAAGLESEADETGVHFLKVHRSSGEGSYQVYLSISGGGTIDYTSNFPAGDTSQDEGEFESFSAADVDLPEPNGSDIPF